MMECAKSFHTCDVSMSIRLIYWRLFRFCVANFKSSNSTTGQGRDFVENNDQ